MPLPSQVIERLTERRIAVEKAVNTLGEAPSGLRDVFELCRGFERAFANIVNVSAPRLGLLAAPPLGSRPAAAIARSQTLRWISRQSLADCVLGRGCAPSNPGEPKLPFTAALVRPAWRRALHACRTPSAPARSRRRSSRRKAWLAPWTNCLSRRFLSWPVSKRSAAPVAPASKPQPAASSR